MQLPLAAPVAAGQPSAAIVRMHSPVCHRVLTMTASRAGLPPVVPSLTEEQYDADGNREVLANDEIELLAPTLNPGGLGRQYAVRIMRTLLDRAPTAIEKLRSGASPLDKLGAGEHRVATAIA